MPNFAQKRIYSEKLKNQGHDVILAPNTSLAIQYINDRKPNLVLLDIMLPGKMNGFEFLSALKKNPETKDIPVVVLTNLDTEKEEAMDLGADDYLIKANLSLEDLAQKVVKFAK